MDTEIDLDAGENSEYGRLVGDRLRSIRRQKRLSLQDVEANSGQEFKASVLGAYERGERAISVPRLRRLAAVYDVPVDQLLPHDEHDDEVIDLTDSTRRMTPESVKLDLTAIADLTGAEAEMLTRYLRGIQVQRGDFNGKVLTVRRDDLRAIACILGVTTDRALSRLDQLGLCRV